MAQKDLRSKLASLFQVVPNALQSAKGAVNRGLNYDLSSQPGTQSVASTYQAWKQMPSNRVGNQVFAQLPTTPQKQETINQNLQLLLGKNTPQTTAAQGFNNWFSAPLYQIPYRLQEATKARKAGNKLEWAGNVAQAGFGLLPGVDDLAIAGYNAAKTKAAKGSFREGLAGNVNTGLGTAVTGGKDNTLATILNLAELPLLIAGGVGVKGGLKAISNADDAVRAAKSTLGDVAQAPKGDIKGVGEIKSVVKDEMPDFDKFYNKTTKTIDDAGYVKSASAYLDKNGGLIKNSIFGGDEYTYETKKVLSDIGLVLQEKPEMAKYISPKTRELLLEGGYAKNIPQPPKGVGEMGVEDVNGIKTEFKSNTQSFAKQEKEYAKLQEKIGEIGTKFEKNTKKLNPEKEFKNAGVKTEQSMRKLYKKFVRNTESFNDQSSAEIPTGGAKSKGPLRQAAESFILTTRKIVNDMGNAGKYATKKMDEYVDLAQNKGGNWLADYKNSIRGVSDESLSKIFDAQRGESVVLTPKELAVKEKIAGILDQVALDAQDAGLTIKRADGDVPFVPRENYFPQFLDREKLKANPQLVIDHLVKTGQMDPGNADAFVADIINGLSVRDAYFARNFPGTVKRYGNLEYSRILDLPKEVLRNDKAVLTDYLNGSAQRIARANIFGANDEAVEPIVTEIGRSGGNMETAQRFFDSNFGIVPRTPSDVLSGKIRSVQSAAKLPLFALSNAAQSVNTATTTGSVRTFKTIANFLLNSGARKDMIDYTTRTGELNSSILRDFSRDVNSGGEGILSKLTGPGGKNIESFNRIIATNAGKKYAEDMTKRILANPNDKTAIKAFRKLGLDPQTIIKQGGLSQGDAIKAGQTISDITQFKVNQADLPPQFSTTWGKVLFQYKQFAYKQGEFLFNEVAKEAVKGNLEPLSRYLIIGGLVGLPLAEIKRRIYGKERPDTPQGLYLEAISSVGGMGILQDMVYAAQGGQKMINFILGPTGGDAVKLAAGIETFRKTGDATDLLRLGTSFIPLVGGVAARRLFPYESQKYKVGESIVPAKTPEGIKSQKSQIAKKMDAGKKVSQPELEFYYLYDANKLTTGNNYEKALKENAYFKASNAIIESNLTPEQKQLLLNSVATKSGKGVGDFAYFQIADQDVDARTGFMVDRLNEVSDPTARMKVLIASRNIVNGKMILQSSVIKNLEDMGLITSDEADMLGDVYLKGGKPTASSVKSKKGKKIAVKQLPKGKKIQVGVKKLSSKLPTLKTKKAKTVKSKPPSVKLRVRYE